MNRFLRSRMDEPLPRHYAATAASSTMRSPSPAPVTQERSVFNALSITRSIAPLFCLVLTACGEDPADTAVRLIAEGNPAVSEEHVSFHGCELRIRIESTDAGSNSSSLVLLRADLAVFKLQTVKIAPGSNGSGILRAQRKPVTEKLLDQAERIVKGIPAGLEGEAGQMPLVASREALQSILAKPDGQFSFKISTVITDGAPLRPHEDGPVFFRLAEHVEALPAPQTATVSLLFQEGEPAANTLAAGTIQFPAVLRLGAASVEDAKTLVQVLFDYREGVCPQD